LIIAGLSPGVILIAGDVTSTWHRFGPVIEKEAAALTLVGTAPRILPSYEGEIARLRGASVLVFQRQFQLRWQAGLPAVGKTIGPPNIQTCRERSRPDAWNALASHSQISDEAEDATTR